MVLCPPMLAATEAQQGHQATPEPASSPSTQSTEEDILPSDHGWAKLLNPTPADKAPEAPPQPSLARRHPEGPPSPTSRPLELRAPEVTSGEHKMHLRC